MAQSPKITILAGNGDGTFLGVREYSVGGGVGLAIADFNADGRQDIVGTIYVFNIVIVLI
ncbi:MAG: VCBS repeat-containing protein [Candidatus Midichloria sp.]|nr:VCBS repeat-containing protein [Candidatus Midichloria sp.]